MSFDISLIGPALLCFAVGALFALIDVHRLITEQGRGTAPIPYVIIWETNLFFACVGGTSVALFCFSLAYPHSWIEQALGWGADNYFARALAIGASTTLLIHSKLLEFEGNKIGPEYIYELFRNWAVNAYKATASTRKISIAQNLAPRSVAMKSFEENLIAVVNNAIDHRGVEIQKRFKDELENTAKLKQSVDAERYNEILIRLAIDFTNIRTLRKWIRSNSQLRQPTAAVPHG